MEEKDRNTNAIDVLLGTSTTLQPWTAEIQGEGPFLVIFNSKIYKNDWWVDAGKCPGNVAKDGINHNPWRQVRKATDAEIAEHGNPMSCEEVDVKIIKSTVQAWTTTLEGEGPFYVIFNGKIYKNAWWVDAGKCPGNINKDGMDHNPWRKVRSATDAEIAEHGNPTSCDDSDVKIKHTVQAWTATLEGEGPFYVIFNGDIYKNAWWLDAGKCPGNVNKDGMDHNPWRKVRKATSAEIAEYGNPINCNKDVIDDNTLDNKVQPFLVEDLFTLNTYKSKGLLKQPDNPEKNFFKEMARDIIFHLLRHASVTLFITAIKNPRKNLSYAVTLPIGVNMMLG